MHKKILKNKTNVRKTLPFSNKVWYYKSKANTCSENMFGMYVWHEEYEEEKEMTNTAGTTQEMRRKRENHKLSRTMAAVIGLIVTLEVMVAGGMIFNVDFHSTDLIALIFGFMVLYAGVVAVLTDN